MKKIFKKLFLTNSYFTIALRRRRSQSIITDPDFSLDYVIASTADHWIADPMIVEEKGRTWLFYEAVENNHGHIEVVEVFPNNTLGEPVTLLKDECHYSYPFVFRWNGTWYMIPESSSSREVRLYQADLFPFTWHKKEILLHERAVDTTVFEKDGKLFLLTFLLDDGTEHVFPRAYAFYLHDEKTELIPIPWESYDTLMVRGAGPIFMENNQLYRPVQMNQEQEYGNGVAFFCLTANDFNYSEKIDGTLRPPTGRYRAMYFDGAHTYCRSSHYEAIDLRCRDFDLWKTPRRIARLLFTPSKRSC